MHFKRELLNASKHGKCSSAKFGSNVFGLLKLGISTLSRLQYLVVPLDKEPGFAFIRPSDVFAFGKLALSGSQYRPFALSTINVDSLVRQYRALSRDIGKHHQDQRLGHNINSSLASGLLVSPMTIFVKSHKPAGEQLLRTVHSCSKPAFHGLSKWLASVLRPLADSMPWCAGDSFAARNGLKGLVITEQTIIGKFDLKDFYLSGDLSTILLVFRAAIADATLSGLVQRAIYILLDNQYLITRSHQHLYKCVSGSGIGLTHSEMVATILF